MSTLDLFRFLQRNGGRNATRLASAAPIVLAIIDAVFHLAGAIRAQVWWYPVGFAILMLTGVVGMIMNRDRALTPRAAGWLSVSIALGASCTVVYLPSYTEGIFVYAALWLGVQLGRWVWISHAMVFVGLLPLVIVHGRAGLPCAVMTLLSALIIATGNQSLAQRFRRSCAALVRTRRYRDSVIETVDVGIAVLDRNGRTVVANPRMHAFTRMTHQGRVFQGMGEDGVVYSDHNGTRIPADELPTVRAMRGEEFSGELIWVGASDAMLTLSVSARTIFSPTGDFDGVVLAYHDVTDLVRALRVKDDFVASVSHELRTPLTAIMGYVDFILESEPISSDVAEHLRRVQNNSVRLNRLVEDLLLSATDTPTLRPERLNLAELVESQRSSTQVRAQRAGVRIGFEIEDAWVDGDRAQLLQVVDNLIGNAIKYTPAGGEVLVRSGSSHTDAMFEVKDTGVGLSPDEQHRIFERFYRADSAHADAITGVGLGLAICRDVVRAHGGSITVSSAPNQGSTFSVSLPMQLAEQPSDFAPAIGSFPTRF